LPFKKNVQILKDQDKRYFYVLDTTIHKTKTYITKKLMRKYHPFRWMLL